MPFSGDNVGRGHEIVAFPARGDAAIDGQDRAGDVAGFVGCEEVKSGSDLLGRTEAAKRRARLGEGNLGVVGKTEDGRGGDRAGAYAITVMLRGASSTAAKRVR